MRLRKYLVVTKYKANQYPLIQTPPNPPLRWVFFCLFNHNQKNNAHLHNLVLH